MEDINSVFEKIKKAGVILDELDRKRGDNTVENNALAKLDKEYLNNIANARHTLASIKEKLSKELAVKILELDKCQEDLATLDARLKVGEITDTQGLIAAKFAENIAPVIQSGKALVVAGPLIDTTPAPQKAVEPQEVEID